MSDFSKLNLLLILFKVNHYLNTENMI